MDYEEGIHQTILKPFGSMVLWNHHNKFKDLTTNNQNEGMLWQTKYINYSVIRLSTDNITLSVGVVLCFNIRTRTYLLHIIFIFSECHELLRLLLSFSLEANYKISLGFFLLKILD